MKSIESLPYELGDRVKDTVTGFTGVAVCVIRWLNGCLRVGIQSAEMKDGRPVDAYYIDAEQVVLVESKVATLCEPSGGPCPDPARRPDPSPR